MPKNDIDYSKTIIYKIVCNDLNITDCYVGQTTNFSKRKAQHKCDYNHGSILKVYEMIRSNGGWDNWVMIMINEYNCKDKLEASKLEREWYEKLNAKLNTQCPNRTLPEYRQNNKEVLNKINQEYRQNNKETIKIQKKEYYETNKETISRKHKEYHQNNKETIKMQHKEYRQNNIEVIKEKKKEYYETKRESVKEKTKEYRENNKEAISEKRSLVCQCDCGCNYTNSNKARHMKSAKHQEFINNLEK